MQKLRYVLRIIKAAMAYLWNDQRDIVLIWGLFCLLSISVGFFELNGPLFFGGIAGFFLMLAFGVWLITFVGKK